MEGNLKTLQWFCEPQKAITWLRFAMGISRSGNRDGSSQCSLRLCRACRRCSENNIAHCKETTRPDGRASSRYAQSYQTASRAPVQCAPLRLCLREFCNDQADTS